MQLTTLPDDIGADALFETVYATCTQTPPPDEPVRFRLGQSPAGVHVQHHNESTTILPGLFGPGDQFTPRVPVTPPQNLLELSDSDARDVVAEAVEYMIAHH